MKSNDFICHKEINQILGEHTGHIEVRLSRLPNANLLWLNRRAMSHDPRSKNFKNIEEYERHLIDKCAYYQPCSEFNTLESTDTIVAIVDRYGGEGIGRNGGSGRAAFINGYHVKGLGRTPLVSHMTDPSHGSGGAGLEECVREAIFSEITEAEFPHGSIPVLAIIDTGYVKIWNTKEGLKPERQCLLIRPAFLRPAHFIRAIDFISHNPKEGALDANRVTSTMKQACRVFGKSQFGEIWNQFWLRWAQQLAHAFVHRINHGGNTESNISLDGRLLDFGAMSSLPSWARITLAFDGPPAGLDMTYLVRALHRVAPILAKYLDESFLDDYAIKKLLNTIEMQYRKSVIFELLRILGLSKVFALDLINGSMYEKIQHASNRLFSHYSKEQFDIFDGMPSPRILWNINNFWDDPTPKHLEEMRGIIDAYIFSNAHKNYDCIKKSLSMHCRLRTKTRKALFRDTIKNDLYYQLEGNNFSDDLLKNHVTNIIYEYILTNRLYTKFDPSNAVLVGFAISDIGGYALFRSIEDNSHFAMQEWHCEIRRRISNLERVSFSNQEGNLIEISERNGLTGIYKAHLVY